MKNIEKTLEALVNYVLAENPHSQLSARKELERFVRGVKPAKMEPEWMIREILTEIGVPDHLTGHPYIVRAVLMIIDDCRIINSITGVLYPTLASTFDTTAARVERAIRNAIETAWTRGDPDVRNSYFGNIISAEKGKPTNGEFLARIANIIRMDILQ